MPTSHRATHGARAEGHPDGLHPDGRWRQQRRMHGHQPTAAAGSPNPFGRTSVEYEAPVLNCEEEPAGSCSGTTGVFEKYSSGGFLVSTSGRSHGPWHASRHREADRCAHGYCVATNEKFPAEEIRSGSLTQRAPSTFARADPTLATAAAPAALRVAPQPPTKL